jgi:glyoxylase-like metal-dependent hydrolase (beta-lactamase superfamily II)
MPSWMCAACAVEYPDSAQPPSRCPICDDERQYVPPSGQEWLSLEQLAADGYRVKHHEVEPGLHALWADPKVGIGQHGHLVQTDAGNVLWDPPGFLDDDAVTWIRGLGGVAAIVASHPHMFGAQVSWSRALDNAPVLVAEADREWVQREDAVIRSWSDDVEPVPGVTLRIVGGHFPGSAVLHFPGADGRGVLLSGDTIFPGPSERWVTFLRSYPNSVPLSAAVVERVVNSVNDFAYDRMYGNFGQPIRSDAREAVRRSADRYVAWVRGDFDQLT